MDQSRKGIRWGKDRGSLHPDGEQSEPEGSKRGVAEGPSSRTYRASMAPKGIISDAPGFDPSVRFAHRQDEEDS